MQLQTKFPTVSIDELSASGVKCDQDEQRDRAPARQPVALVVDDDRLIADSTTAVLATHGFRAHAAYGGAEALRIARELRPDLVLTDVRMPRLNGVEVALQLRRQMPHCVVLLFSGEVEFSDLPGLGGAPAAELELLRKPLHPKDLVARLRQLGFRCQRAA